MTLCDKIKDNVLFLVIKMCNEIKHFILENKELMLKTLQELCSIPAPSHYEQKRAEYCRDWLENNGATDVYIDDALNVVFEYNCKGVDNITLFSAHTDTVFPDTEPMPYFDDGEKIHCPGVADDTASVVVLLLAAKYFIENPYKSNAVLFVFNSCEEGLGNLKGMRALFETYGKRITKAVCFDCNLGVINDRCVGSHRYCVKIETEGGHSFEEFGKTNAIAVLSGIISDLYKIEIPQKTDTRTTYNVGTISGGTSVNTIAQTASMLCEYRSSDAECLNVMRDAFFDVFERAKSPDISINVFSVGERPCSITPQEKVDELKAIASKIVRNVTEKAVIFESASTDCNIPLSLGIPAICVGVNNHNGIHTREEWVEKESLTKGLEIAINLVEKLS